MIIFGDFASPRNDLRYTNFPVDDLCVFNCEGYLIKDISETNGGVYNSLAAVLSIPSPQLLACLANNHVSDKHDGVTSTIEMCKNNNINTVGAGINSDDAETTFVTNHDNCKIAVINAGWDVVGCIHATNNSAGVMALNTKQICNRIVSAKNIGCKVLIYAHWGYELERYPHPAHRNMARRFIDFGADLVVGCHAHIPQGFEIYKETAILYGLGNAVFEKKYYYNGTLEFPESSNWGICVDWHPSVNKIKIAKIQYLDGNVNITNFQELTSTEYLYSLTGVSSAHYLSYFKQRRYKKKFIPIFVESDDTFSYACKCLWVKLRTKFILVLLALRIKGYSRK